MGHVYLDTDVTMKTEKFVLPFPFGALYNEYVTKTILELHFDLTNHSEDVSCFHKTHYYGIIPSEVTIL
jgi:hypothetical protein